MCNDNAYIYFSDLVPSQNSYVVTEKPLACSQGTSKYADCPLHSCMPWFINPSEHFEHTQLKKKKKKHFFFPIITSPGFLMGMQFGKGRGLFLKLHLLRVSLQEMMASVWWDGPLLGNPKRNTAFVKCHASEGLPTAFPEWILSRSRTQPSEEVFCSKILIFSFQDSESSSLQCQPLSHCSTKLALLLEPVPEPVICCVAGKHHGACQCTEDVCQHWGGWDSFSVPEHIPEHIPLCYWCYNEQKYFKHMPKSCK